MGNILIIVFKKQPDMLIVNLLRILQISMNPNLFFFLIISTKLHLPKINL